MTLPAECPGGGGSERKLELVPTPNSTTCSTLERARSRRCEACVLTPFPALPSDVLPGELLRLARPALHVHKHNLPAATAADGGRWSPGGQALWRRRCAGALSGRLHPRLGAQGTIDALERQRKATTVRLEDERNLARAVNAPALTQPRPGGDSRHWQALRQRASQAHR